MTDASYRVPPVERQLPVSTATQNLVAAMNRDLAPPPSPAAYPIPERQLPETVEMAVARQLADPASALKAVAARQFAEPASALKAATARQLADPTSALKAVTARQLADPASALKAVAARQLAEPASALKAVAASQLANLTEAQQFAAREAAVSMPRHYMEVSMTEAQKAIRDRETASPRSTPAPSVSASRSEKQAANPALVIVYVRKGASNDERWLSFNIPSGLESFDLLSRGVALDGNQGIFSVAMADGAESGPYYYPTFAVDEQKLADGGDGAQWDSSPTWPAALRAAEFALTKFLKARGFGVTFR